MRRLLALALPALAACSPTEGRVIHETHAVVAVADTAAPFREIQLDPAFEAEQLEAMHRGIETWFRAIPEMRVPVVIGYGAEGNVVRFIRRMGEPMKVEVNEDGVEVNEGGVEGSLLAFVLDGGTVNLWVDGLPSNKLANVAAHELGHVYGMGHLDLETSDPSALMRPIVSAELSCITEEDLELARHSVVFQTAEPTCIR